jgi:hypothetical protein
MAESMIAAIEATTKGRTSCFPFWHFGSTTVWMHLRPYKADAVKPSIFSGKISLFVIEKAA